MRTKKELTKIFGNITYVISRGLRCEPKLVTLTQDIPCQLFYFPKYANNLLLCLYLDGEEPFERIIFSVYCVDSESIDTCIPKNFLGDDFNYRTPCICVYTQCIGVDAASVCNWSVEEIISVILSNKAFIKNLKKILKSNKRYEKFRSMFEFVPNSIDIMMK